MLAIAIGVVILGIVIAELPLRGWPPPIGWRLLNAGGLFLLAGTVAVTMLAWRDPALLVPSAKPVPETARSEPDDSLLLPRLQAEMARERLYRQEG